MTTSNEVTERAALSGCPFCGMSMPEDLSDTFYPSGIYWRDEEDFRSYHDMSDAKPGDGRCFQIVCTTHSGGCGASVVGDTAAETIAAWNRRTPTAAIPRTSAEAVLWIGPHANAWDALNETRKAVADIIGADPDVWPDHGNAPLAIAAAIAIRQNAMERADATPAPADSAAEHCTLCGGMGDISDDGAICPHCNRTGKEPDSAAERDAAWLDDEPSDAMLHAGGEVIYGHPRSDAVEWAKADKFDSCQDQAGEVYRAMRAAMQQKDE